MTRHNRLQTGFLEKRARPRTTLAMTRLWNRLRGHRLAGIGFRRQHAIGPYTVDFCAPRHKLIIELDGAHQDSQASQDLPRADYLRFLGYTTLRFTNSEVLHSMDFVLQTISEQLQDGSS